ncbi:LysR family transcriptional regulator [Burkholderia pseudomultivorans]|uniref:LysR family transcriptional regulator n=1 Tax=Burkholderia pseudomultivorans TaxID=1207504 RepID=UPI0001FD7690|nr:LysR family transcriptional regulator [Burkholderia pseudomultivorans]EGD06430.1 LysR family transcriptional regulator [Burkholderia sp. TJI49]AOI91359.1 LysR family transcriptional regulator [Burkholderia pseudomultivorans]KVC17417.1 LysR family transcriptional regulator [Burkholderia pseudomultivorans]KVC40084.1 LysR family transcriptional regulator [Burkholderia pseudomultivorans]KVC47005.1 LysR family transcriptional regulator [Burkholderia pseudomultivorans]
MNQIQTMRVFVCVAEQQSFRRAAHHLGVSNALVTRSIAMLEGHLNTRLIHRTTRNLSLTEAGARYLDGCRALLEEFDHLEASVAHAAREPGGTLRIVASGLLSPLALTPLVSSFRQRYPELRVHLTVAEGPLDMLDSGYDVGIVTGDRLAGNPALIGHPLAPNPFVACAAPAYLERRGEPRSPDDLPRHDWIALAPHQHTPAWRLVGPDEVVHAVTVRPACTVNQLALVQAAVVAGSGIAMLPSHCVADAIDNGTLVRLLPTYRIDDPDAQLSLVYPNRQFVPARTRSFVEHALEHFGTPTQRERADYGFLRPARGERPDIVTGLQ